jgi:hypothetical protein
MDNEPQEPKKHDTIKEKAAEGWEEFKNQATLWVEDIISNKKKLVPILIVTIIGIFAFIRGLIKIWFY